MKYFNSIVVAIAAVTVYADTPDLTGSLEFIANPQMDRWPNNALARACLDLQFYQGRLFNGGGEVESNPGAPWISSIDPYDNSTKFEFDPGTEAIANYLVTSWGDLLTPSQDPHEGDANLGHVFSRNPEGVWNVFKSVGGSVAAGTGKTVANNTHCWDMEEFDGRIFVSCYNLQSSTDHCKTFTACSPITDAYHSIGYCYAYTSKYWYTTISTLRRQMHLLRFGDSELFAIGNTVVQPQYIGNSKIDSTQANCQEFYRYDKTTHAFTVGSQPVSDIYPGLSTNDYKLVGRNLAYLATNKFAKVWARIWHTTPFKNRVLYVGCYDTPPYGSVSKPYEDSIALTSYPLPLMGCSATVTSGKIKATRISFGNDKTNYPWDFAVAGDAVYALTSRYVADGKKNHHVVWKSTDGVNFTEVFSFDFHQNFISLEYRDGWFYLGVGYKAATKGYAYDNTADESGAIYRVRCPQEPVQVVPSVDSLEIAEGASATVSFRLSSQPSSNLTLRVGAALKNTRFTTDKSTLTFTTSDWNTPKSVTISVDDNDILDLNRSGAVVCGAAGFDVVRGEFSGSEVTAGVINLTLGDSEFAPPANGEIRTADDFYCAMAFPDGDYRMMNDIDLTDSLFTTVPEFSGTLDGCGYTLSGLGDGPLATLNRGVIRNLTLDGTVSGKATEVKGIARGIFFDKMSGGAFTNCVLKGYTLKAGAPDTILGLFVAEVSGPCEFAGCSTAADCTLSQAGSHDCSIGGMVGKIGIPGADGIIASFIDCTNNAAIAASDNYRTASGAGGFVGYVTGSASVNQSEIRFVRSANNGTITGKDRYSVLGGFAGRFNASNSNKSSTLAYFADCVNNASISHTGNGKSSGAAGGFAGIIGNAANAVFDRCVNRGDVTGPSQLSAGGLVGEFGNPSPVGENGIRIVNSANYGDIAATNNVGGLIGKSTGSTGTGWKNGHWRFLNSANYGSLAATAVTVNGELSASVSCEATAATASITVSNCWTVTDRLFATTSRQPVCGGNYTAATAAATAAAALDAVAAKVDGYLGWTVGQTGNPELLFVDASEEEPDDPPPPAHVHEWGAWTTNVAPTCVTAGERTRVCSAEGCTDPVATETQPVAALGHVVVVDPAVAPTESSTGLTEGSHCSRCGAILVAQQVVPKLIPGQTLYVATTGSDSASGAFDAPLLTISNAVARLGSVGGTVMVGPGEYKIYDPIVITTPVNVVGSGCGNEGTVVKNIGTYNYNTHANCRVMEVSNAVAIVQGLVMENGYVGMGSGMNHGGGVMLTSGTVSNCVIRGCTARQGSTAMPYGGGAYVFGAHSLLTHCVISNCISHFDANWGSVCGAGVHVDGGKVSNVLVVDCHGDIAEPEFAKIVGGIMLTDGTAENCTVVNCWGSKAGGICASPAKNKTVSVVNCVAFGCEKKLKDGEGVLQTTSSNSDGTASCFVNCSFDATAAAFADYANGDYRPAAGGVLVDAGAAIVGAPAGDLDGRPRVVGTAIDIGCFEWQEGGAVELETPVLSGSSFGFSGTGKFSIAVENPVRGAYYTVFTTEDLQGAFIAESASVLCGGETLVLEMDASAPQKFAKIVVSASPFEAGATCP